MLSRERLGLVMDRLEQGGCRQMLVTDPAAIFYLTGRWILPGERFLGLLVSADREPVLLLNELFRFDGEIGVRKVAITDTTDLPALIRTLTDPAEKLGVDKSMAARYLLPLMDAGIAASYANTSVLLDDVRAAKEAGELELMREASRINDRAMADFAKLIRPGISEHEAAAECLGIYKKYGASGFSFSPIVAFGLNAADPHHFPDDTVIREGDAVLFDVGCVYENYCSDMTRTFFWKTEPSAEAKRIYDLVRRANEEAEAMLKPGIPLCDVDAKARGIIADGGYGEDFTHRLGHFIGIEVHESGDVSAANRNLAAVGNVFSIEPGIYHAPVAGVRIEDLAIITPDGHEILNAYPKELTVLE